MVDPINKKVKSWIKTEWESPYLNNIKHFLKNENSFNNFKHHKSYTAIVETVNKKMGGEYLKATVNNHPYLIDYFDKFKTNDKYGNPNIFPYDNYGKWSPTTLRYIHVLSQLIHFFGDLNDFKIVEIGGGYGGQCKIIKDYFNIKEYIIYDLDDVSKLQNKYLNKFNLSDFRTKSYTKIENEKNIDLVISNWALSELHPNIQEEYIKNILNNSKSGFLIWNYSKKSYSPVEMIKKIKGSSIIKYSFGIYKNLKTIIIKW